MAFSNLNSYIPFLSNLTVRQLKHVKQSIDNILESIVPEDRKLASFLDIDKYVNYRDNFLTTEEQCKALDCLRSDKRFDNHTSHNKLSKTDQAYDWVSKKSGIVTHNKAVSIAEFPVIDSMLDKVNSELGTNLNSCLVMYYPNSGSGVRVHDDCDDTFDANQPIAVVSLGASRVVEFFNNYQSTTERPAKTVAVHTGSMYVMEPGCQQYLFCFKSILY